MLVDIVIDFKDGHTQYYAGERVWMETDDAEKFVTYGWAALPDTAPALRPVGTTSTLTIHDGQLGHTSEY